MLASFPQKDGTCKVTVDWPYYVNSRSRRYYQHHDKVGAEEAANTFAAKRRSEGALSAQVIHNADLQNFECIYVVTR